MNFDDFRIFVSNEEQAKREKKLKQKQHKTYDFSDRDSYADTLKKQKEIESAKLKNTIKSFTKMMAHSDDRTMLFLTFTLPPIHGVQKHLESADSIKNHLDWQAKSMAYHIRKLLKSKKFKRNKDRRCALDDPIHFLWTLELQEKGDAHLHGALFLKDDPILVKDTVRLIHEHRAKHDVITSCYHNGGTKSILPLGRCHIGMHPKFKPALEELSVLEEAEKKRKNKISYEPKRYEYFMSDIAHFHYRYDSARKGQGTAIEFYGTEKLKQSYDNLTEYISKITEAKYSKPKEEKALKTAVYTEMMDHHIKGTLEVDDKEKLKSDSEIFSFIGVKTIHYSQALFPTKLYQSLRMQLIEFSEAYKSLYKLTLDQCNGKIIIEDVIVEGYRFKQVAHINNGVIAGEQFKQGVWNAN